MTDEVAKLTPAERMTKGLCPECGRDLKGINPLGERDYHWDVEPLDRPESRNALARYMMLTNYAADLDAAAEAARVDARRKAAK